MRVEFDHFLLSQIADSGQCFRWKKISDDEYRIIAFGRVLNLKQSGSEIEADCSQEEWCNIWAPYLDCDTDYLKIEKLIMASNDVHLQKAYEAGFGIRILNQDLWEIIISFLISQNNNIPRIKKSIEAICERAGLQIAGQSEYAFPGPSLLDVSMFDDSTLGLGYRAPYLKEMYEYCRENPAWLENLKELSYEDARKLLLERKGIGPKVADCICLFGLHHIEAFPIDTHVRQLLSKYYPNGFNHECFKGYAGIIQQYLFYYEIK